MIRHDFNNNKTDFKMTDEGMVGAPILVRLGTPQFPEQNVAKNV
jgi:hypothetical protein